MNTTAIILTIIGAMAMVMILLIIHYYIRARRASRNRYAKRDFGRLTAFFLRLSGHHPAEFENQHPTVTWRFAAVGLSVLFPPLIAFAGTWASCEVFDIGGSITNGLIVAAFVLGLDFILVATLSGKGGGWSRWFLVAYRAVVAIGIGWFVARAPILLLYQSSIESVNLTDRWSDIRKTADEADAFRKEAESRHLPLMEHYAKRRAFLEGELKSLAARKDPVLREIARLDREIEIEDLQGADGRPPGRGDFYNKRKEYANKERAKLADIEVMESKIHQALEDLAAEQEEERSKLLGDPVYAELGEAASKHIEETSESSLGWSEREDLLIRWAMMDPTVRLPGLVAIHVLLLLLDVLPLVTMIFVPRKELERQRQYLAARDDAEAECAMRHADDDAEVLVRERSRRELMLKAIPYRTESSELRIEFAQHIVLRREQALAEARPIFMKLRFGSSKKPTPEQLAAWEEASLPIHKACEQELRDLETLIR